MNHLDALLITPPSRLEVYQELSGDYAAIEPPVWSSLIARYLLIRGFSVKILDAEAENYTHEETAKIVLKENPHLAIYMIYGQQPSASTQCMPGGNKTASIVNEKSNKEIKSIVIGTHASSLPKRTLLEEPYTFVCQGEGPLTIQELIKIIKKGSKDYKNVPGLWYNEDGEIKNNKIAPMFENLDQNLPGQAWELLDLSKYKAHNWHTFHDLDSRNKYASWNWVMLFPRLLELVQRRT